jgi:hypothetical protein
VKQYDGLLYCPCKSGQKVQIVTEILSFMVKCPNCGCRIRVDFAELPKYTINRAVLFLQTVYNYEYNVYKMSKVLPKGIQP